MATKTVRAIVLSRKNFGEADRLLSFFSKEEGKIKVVARGSRKIKSKMASHIEPFSIGNYFLAEGKTFQILAGAEAVKNSENLIKNLELYQDASYICEILDMTLPEQMPNIKLFNLASQALTFLSNSDESKRGIILRYFEYQLLANSGLAASFEACHKCSNKLELQDFYAGGIEGIYCKNCIPDKKTMSLEIVKILRLFEKKDLSDILKIKGIEQYSSELQGMIKPSLYDILPRAPKSKIL